MASDMRLDSLSSWEQESAPLDLEADAALERAAPPVPQDAGGPADALPLLLILLFLLLSPILYDLLWRLGTR